LILLFYNIIKLLREVAIANYIRLLYAFKKLLYHCVFIIGPFIIRLLTLPFSSFVHANRKRVHCNISEFDKGLRTASLHVFNGEHTSTAEYSSTLRYSAVLGRVSENEQKQERRCRPFFTRPARNGGREKELFSSGRAHNAIASGQ